MNVVTVALHLWGEYTYPIMSHHISFFSSNLNTIAIHTGYENLGPWASSTLGMVPSKHGTIYASLTLCERNPSVTGESSHKGSVDLMSNFDDFLAISLNNLLYKLCQDAVDLRHHDTQVTSL